MVRVSDTHQKRRPRHSSLMERAVALAYEQFTHPPYSGVLGIAAGYRSRASYWVGEQVLTVFVQEKIASHVLEARGQAPIPSSLTITVGRTQRVVRTDVVELRNAQSAAQSFGPGSPLSIEPNAGSIGVVSWVDVKDMTYGITAEHVVGLGNLHAPLFSNGKVVGRVSKCGYALASIDAALFDLAPDQTPTSVVAGRRLKPPRAVRRSDVHNPSQPNQAHVYHPGSGILEGIAIHYIHARGLELVSTDGTSFNPRPLTLTDQCTQSGESGTLLLGSDWTPIGLLSGIVTAIDGRSYSCFTELAAALDALVS